MKNLSKATDEEIYHMLNSIKMLDHTQFSNEITKRMEKELENEHSKRNIKVIPLSWDLCRYNNN